MSLTLSLEMVGGLLSTVAANALIVGVTYGRIKSATEQATSDISSIKKALGLNNGHAEPGRFMPRESCALVEQVVSQRLDSIDGRLDRIEAHEERPPAA